MRCQILLFLLFLSLVISCKKTLKRSEGMALGTSYHIIYDSSKVITIDDIFEAINKTMSTYIKDSDISKINSGDTTVVTDENFRKVYRKAKEVWKVTGGLFDPTVENLFKAWDFDENNDKNTPSQKALDSLLSITGMEKIVLKEGGKIIKQNPFISLNFNALAKGYCVDMIANKLSFHGVSNFLVEVGGEIVVKGKNTQTNRDWLVGIENPETSTLNHRTFSTRIKLKNRAMATSGNYRKFKIDPKTHKKYTHIINPKTGYPEQSTTLSATVIANTCMEADAYATAFMIMPLERIKKLLKDLPNLEIFIILNEKGKIKTYFSEGFKALVIKN